MYAQLLRPPAAAVAVFMSNDIDAARRLVAEKKSSSAIWKRSRPESISARARRAEASIETSGLHLDVVRDLKRIDAHRRGDGLSAAGALRRTETDPACVLVLRAPRVILGRAKREPRTQNGPQEDRSWIPGSRSARPRIQAWGDRLQAAGSLPLIHKYDPLVTTLVLIAALCHASWTRHPAARRQARFDGAARRRHAPDGAAGHLLLSDPCRGAAWPFVIASAIVHLGYNTFLALAYHHGELSKVYPLVRGSAPLTTLIVSLLFLNEASIPSAPSASSLSLSGSWRSHSIGAGAF